ncbi:DUF448 domain-containing protein [Arcobacter porcinus]|uniref:Putative RNA-binding protein (DUF448 domain) n=1 Tax=Arcobacter porcinus TaxID=1935204 RepID=A0A1C0B185_9BACT|nr:hypothetical protein AAW30_01784 [Arcobacter porcinus]OCL88306.1 hypothetical protein AAX27_02020 [Aliarcobacter thereius]OCL89058.1 hypothetical protein AAX30_00190 [Arcobacter porcinus]OCL93500.1 hypothetical protein AAX28_01043 [Arcobacter porcinus]QEP39914.1 putative RNA-binding protein (DUF448 domain) [Arcobacter porcinus]
MANSKKILRTCVFCREKLEQKELLRFVYQNERLSFYNNLGRSFYLCRVCILKLKEELTVKDSKRIEKVLNKECKSKQNHVNQLKEILLDVR